MDEINPLEIGHWPFFAACAVFAMVGQFTSKSVFTRERAYAPGRAQWFWWWGRESLSLHAILAGCAVGYFWRDPEGVVWGAVPAMTYFGAAGVASLFFWVAIKAVLKSKGIRLTLPGQSDRPSEAPSEP